MSGVFRVRDREFSTGTHVMAILNATPDSFYPFSRVGDDCVRRALEAVAQGAEIIDIGGQSTRPNGGQVSVLEELSRVLPVVESVRAATDCPISVDTYYPEVAEAVLEAGADMINDVTCLLAEGMAETVARYGAAVCIMHNRRCGGLDDLMADKLAGLSAAVDKALRAGVRADGIILDGGIGFNRSNAEDWELLDRYRELSMLGYPLLLGTSRKSMFGGQPETRLTATMETSAFAAREGILFVRVHDVRENLAVISSVRDLPAATK